MYSMSAGILAFVDTARRDIDSTATFDYTIAGALEPLIARSAKYHLQFRTTVQQCYKARQPLQ